VILFYISNQIEEIKDVYYLEIHTKVCVNYIYLFVLLLYSVIIFQFSEGSFYEFVICINLQ